MCASLTVVSAPFVGTGNESVLPKITRPSTLSSRSILCDRVLYGPSTLTSRSIFCDRVLYAQCAMYYIS
jgi:hypothetical protein